MKRNKKGSDFILFKKRGGLIDMRRFAKRPFQYINQVEYNEGDHNDKCVEPPFLGDV